MMLQVGANPNLVFCNKHIEPLMLAVSQENWAMCEMLLDYGCELSMNVINYAAILGREAVQLFINHAIEKGNGHLLQCLLHNIYNKSGDSVKDLGICRKWLTVEQKLPTNIVRLGHVYKSMVSNIIQSFGTSHSS